MHPIPHNHEPSPGVAVDLDVAVIGAGFSGLYAVYRSLQSGLRVRAFDDAGDIGGTWWWNCYPGARVDSPGAPFFGYTFSEEINREWEWIETQPDQPAILGYLNHVADRLHLRPHVSLSTHIDSLEYDDELHYWVLTTDKGDRTTARFVISAVGGLSAPYIPKFEGLEDFVGEAHHTGHWPQDQSVGFSGKRVGVIGTGSSAVQLIPLIAAEADHLHVFQRTPQFVLPCNSRPIPNELIQRARDEWPTIRQRITETGRPLPLRERSALDDSPEKRLEAYEAAWEVGGMALRATYSDHMTDIRANQLVGDFVKTKIAEIIDDPGTASQLTPDYLFGTKRLILGTGYYETYNRDNVTLVDLKSAPIESVTASGVRTSDQEYEFDLLVLATGYDALTGAVTRLNPVGRHGVTLNEKWAAGVRTYLGIGIEGFPNLFVIQGPQSPSAKFHYGRGLEFQVDWVLKVIAYMDSRQLGGIEPLSGYELAWAEEIAEIADRTLYPQTNSWYNGANIPGKRREFTIHMDGPMYCRRLEEVADSDYEGFTFLNADGTARGVYPELLGGSSSADALG